MSAIEKEMDMYCNRMILVIHMCIVCMILIMLLLIHVGSREGNGYWYFD
jgi:preprotein translocase subunit SecG